MDNRTLLLAATAFSAFVVIVGLVRVFRPGRGRSSTIKIGPVDVKSTDVGVILVVLGGIGSSWSIQQLLALPEPPAPIVVSEATLVANFSEYQGRCPVAVHFDGAITVVGGAGSVVYRFVRDSGPTDARAIRFDQPGTLRVADSVTVPIPEGEFAGWDQLEILQPTRIASEVRQFHGLCSNAYPPGPPDNPPSVAPPG